MSGNTPKVAGLGLEMKRLRESTDIGLREVARRIGVSPATLSRWETGKRVPTPREVARYLAELSAPPEVIADLMDTAAQPDAGLWLAIGLPEQSRQLKTLLQIERSATRIVAVMPLLLPGLLQTADYARAIMAGARVPDDEVETRVAVRLGRRHLLQQPGAANLLALIGEAALHQTIGGRPTMLGQLCDLLAMAERPNIEVRIVPNGAGWHPGLEGAFDYVESSERAPVVLLENRRSALFFHREEDTQLYARAIDDVNRVALPPDRSRTMIAEAITELENV